METQKMFIVVSKKNNSAKVISACDKYHAQNKALIYFPEHELNEIQVLTRLKKAK